MVAREVDFERVGARIKKLRTERGLTQSALSEMIGCSNNHLSHVETAQNKVSLNLLLRLSYVFGVSLDYFLLDTPFARPEAIIDAEIAKKLSRCSAPTLVAVGRMIDAMLDQQDSLSEREV